MTAQVAGADRADDGVASLHGLLDRAGVHHVGLDHLDAVAQLSEQPGPVANHRGHLVPGVDGLADDLPASAASRTEHGEFHGVSLVEVSEYSLTSTVGKRSLTCQGGP